MKTWKSDKELFAIVREELYTAVVGDVMDKMGLRHQFLPPQIQPLHQDMLVIGRAMTVLEANVFQEKTPDALNKMLSKSFGYMLEALDDLREDEVYVCSGPTPSYALWGEIMSTRAMKLGAAGVVLNGFYRDTRGILECGFPTFGYGPYAQDQGPRGKVVDFRVPLEIGQARVENGDIVFGDIDGVCVVPALAEVEIFTKAIEKARGEKTVKKAVEDGMTAVEAFKKYGIM